MALERGPANRPRGGSERRRQFEAHFDPDTLIVHAAHAINRGEPPRTQATDTEVRDFFFIEKEGDAEAADEILTLATERLPSHYDADPIRDVQVLAPIYRGAVGVDALNERLRARLNPEGERLAIPADRTHSLRPAYAISVHKSQGCEMPVVIVPVHTSHSVLLSRNLLYTAVTRARRACVLVGQREAVSRALRRADAFRRNSRLAELLAAGDAGSG